MDEARMKRFLTALEGTGGNLTQAYVKAGVAQNTIKTWRKRYPDFAADVVRMVHGTVADEPTLVNGVPDFLSWRERHCAYEVEKNGVKVVQRAQNFWFQKEAIKAIEENDRLIMVLPPGHLKTSLFGIEYPTWRIQRDRNMRVMMLRANANVAQDNTAAIGIRLEDEDYYAWLAQALIEQGDEPITSPIAAYGGQKGFRPEGRKIGDRWAGGKFTVSGRTSGEKDATVTAIGMDGNIPGGRADCIIIDDPQDPTKFDSSGIEYSQKLMKKWERDILGRPLPGGKIIVLANRLGPDDFIGMLVERYSGDPAWKIIYFPAIISHRGKEQPLCPEIFTLADLAQRRKDVGEEAWAFHYMQEEVSSKYATFTSDTVDSCKAFDHKLGEIPPKASYRVVGVDPAASGYTAIVVWGVNPETGMRYLIDFVNQKGMKEDEILNRTVYEAQRYNAQKIVFEVRNIQSHMYEKLRDLLRGSGIRLQDYKTATATGAQAQELDFSITNIGELFEQRMVSLPFNLHDHETQSKMGEFITQLIRWKPKPPGKTSWHLQRDLVMAMLFAESEARKIVKTGLREKTDRKNRAPKWTQNSEGGWAWQRPRQKVAT